MESVNQMLNITEKDIEFHKGYKKGSKETAKEILDFLRKDNGVNAWTIIRFEKFIKEQYGVEIKE